LSNTDFREPGRVLSALNDAFPMEQYDGKFFTMWYGVYDRARSELAWSNGGHPPALLFAGTAAVEKPQLLQNGNPILGAIPEIEYETARSNIAPGSRLYVYSDGVHEIHKPDGSDWQFDEFIDFMSLPPGPGATIPDQLLCHARRLKGQELLDDDFSMLEVTFH
jgi:sigma-B regulation protein RsbU (phosphoserine phosphatase)